MVLQVTDWTVVMVGQWNPAILSPDWVAKNILHVETIQTEVAVGHNAANLRYQTDNLIILPRQDRLVIGCRNTEDATLLKMEESSKTILHLLSHTPVHGLGVNFGFSESEPHVEMLKTFDLNDNGAIVDEGYNVVTTEIMREISVPGLTAPLRLKMRHSEGTVFFHFNFTHQVSTAQEAAQVLDGKVLDYRNRAITILNDVYNLQGEGVA